MSTKNKRRPARPHFERITRKHAGGADTTVPENAWGYLKKGSTKREPGK